MQAGVEPQLVQEIGEVALHVAPPRVDQLQRAVQVLSCPLAQRTGIAVICPEVSAAWQVGTERTQDQCGAAPIMQAGGVDNHFEQ